MEIHINPNTLTSLKDQVVLVTGSSSGIGHATVQACLQHGAKVIAGDVNPPQEPYPSDAPILFASTDVTDWASIRSLFIAGHAQFGRIDHVFANAGIGPSGNFLEETFDEEGLLAPPVLRTVDINLIGVINTLRLGVHYLKKGEAAAAAGGAGSRSVVLTASASSFQNFPATDYTTAKHGVLGIMRGLEDTLRDSGVRLNAIAPSWTATGLVPKSLIESLGSAVQEPEAVADGVLLLFAEERHGELMYIWDSKYYEINKVKGGLLDSAVGLLPLPVKEDEIAKRLDQARAVAAEVSSS
ncbi:hypothetical protein FE257_000659 [Aspergillus nanangensis]|uniref:Uncharacterized protein n=1 Tax=Aspergillus nanangensis TaxID=2582783 RepID=A0AAD4GRA0_ASPNN|nr:hypothetical protein FE257_000659 [Aspergillus nanangensis]